MDLVENAEILTKTFGQWPSFHDAEIVSLLLSREHENPVLLEVKIHVFETTSAIDSSGAYVSRNHTLVTLRFSGVREDASIQWFNHQNVMAALHIYASESGEPTLRIEMPSLYGADVSFTCDTAEVISATPYG